MIRRDLGHSAPHTLASRDINCSENGHLMFLIFGVFLSVPDDIGDMYINPLGNILCKIWLCVR